MVYKYFDKKSSSANTSDGAVKSAIMSNEELAKKLQKKKLKTKSTLTFYRQYLGCWYWQYAINK